MTNPRAAPGRIHDADPRTLTALLACGESTAKALTRAEDGGGMTYAELDRAVELLARRLRALGVERGDRVALVVADGPEFLQLLLAITSLGAAAAPLNPAYTRDEFAFYLTDLDPRALLVPLGEAEAARAATRESVLVVDVGSDSREVALGRDGRTVDAQSAFEPAQPNDIALLLHTSGTTSRPKQVPLLHRNLAASATGIAAHYLLSEGDTSYCLMPLFHVHGLVGSTLATLASGGTVVVPRRVAPRRAARHLREHGVTWFSAGPTLHHMLLEHADSSPADLPHLRFVRSCSSALSPALLARAEEYYRVPMLEAYGMTEASHQISSNPLPPAPRFAGSVGVPTGARIRIVDRDGGEVPPGQAGEVQIQGAGLTPGYLNNPDANAEAFVDGWFRTGDYGVTDDGYLRLQGRLKEMIIRGGENISPSEIEEILLRHPAVADAACFGVPDEKYGEEVAAAVALKAETSGPELIAHCRERLAPFKVPTTIHVLDAIPRTPTGKLQRRRIAASLNDETQ